MCHFRLQYLYRCGRTYAAPSIENCEFKMVCSSCENSGHLSVAVAQFTVAEEPERNLEILDGFARDAAAGGAKLLVLPEGLIARRGDDDSYAAAHAQPLDGPFVDGLRRISAQRHIVLMGTVHVAPEQGTERDADSRVSNTFLVIRDGEIIAEYRKLHLYDAFSARESDVVLPRRCVAAYRRY